jgi:hypothetical protein
MKIVKYEILEAKTAKEMNAKVAEKIADGWEVRGELRLPFAERPFFLQLMVLMPGPMVPTTTTS